MESKPTPNTISLDIWDTLLRRKVHPDLIKIFSQQRINILTKSNSLEIPRELLKQRQLWEKNEANYQNANNFDDEYEITKVFKKNLQASNHQIEDFVNFELTIESEFTYPDPSIMNLLRELSYEKYENVIAISDFYFQGSELKKLLTSKLDELRLDEIIVSCEEGFNKRNRLFPHLLESREKFHSEAWIHIGDSLISDVEAPRLHGIKAIHFQPKIEHESRLRKEEEFHERLTTNKWIKSYSPLQQVTLGCIGFSEFVRAEAIKRDAKIIFLEREGLVLKEIYDLATNSNLYNLPSISNETIAVSRIAIFAAAYFVNPNQAISKLLFSYPNVTGEVFLKSLGIRDLTNFIRTDFLYDEFISIKENRHLVTLHCDSKFRNVKNYLSKHFSGGENYLIVDIGWIGSMQEYLAIIFPESNFTGCYLGLQEFSRLLRTGRARSFIDPTSIDGQKILRNVRPIEMIFMPEATAGVIGYSELGEVIRNPDSTKLENPAFLLRLQREICQLIPEMVQDARNKLYSLFEFKLILEAGLSDYLRNPPKEMLIDYLKAEHDETFGVGKRVAHTQRISRKSILISIVFLRIDKLRQQYLVIGWVEAGFYSLFNHIPNKLERLLFLRLINFIQSISRFKRILKIIPRLKELDFYSLFKMLPIFRKSVKEIGFQRSIAKTRFFLRNLLSNQSSLISSKSHKIHYPRLIPNELIFIDDHERFAGSIRNWSAIGFSRGIIAPVATLSEISSFNLPYSRIAKVLVVNLPATVGPQIEYRFPRAKIMDLKIETESEIEFQLDKAILDKSDYFSGHVAPLNQDVAWIIPTLPKASGGHRGMFRTALELKRHGFRPTLYIINDSDNEADLKKRFNANYYQDDIEVKAGLPNKFHESFVVATAHYTLDEAISRTEQNQKVVYFVQDDEALFNPVSSTYFLARQTYFESRASILASGKWMANRIEALTGRKVPYFDFPVDRKIYFSDFGQSNILEKEEQISQIVYYFKPDAERRLADLGIEVLRIVKYFLPNIRIVSFGSILEPDPTVIDQHYGVFETIDEIANLYRNSQIGLVFSPTNPSLIPYEMAACGTVVVDYCEKGDDVKLAICETIGIHVAQPNVNDLASKIIELATNKELLRDKKKNTILKSQLFATPLSAGNQASSIFKQLFETQSGVE